MRAAMFGVFGKGKRGVKNPEPFGSTVGRREFSYSELLEITSDFKNTVHRGGFGPCFHGYVDGLQVFVMLYSSKHKSLFQKEVEVLQRIHHRNLINIVGYCKEDEHLAILLWNMTNGDLGKHLLEKSSSVFTWEARLRIAVQVAQGLEYLHDFCEPPIVHRNLKMDTILLSGNFVAKLCGFRLARPMKSDDISHETTVCGTFGYVDPEYCRTGRLTVKSDVFSFGVVLLVIITGRPAIARDQEYRHLSQWVKFTLEHGGVSDVIDPRMNGEYEIEFVEKALKLAMACVSDTSNARPLMNEVVSGLKECKAC